MSITNELREFAPHLDLGKVALAGWKEGLLAIADRIDAEHEKAVQEKSIRVYTSDADMEHDGWVRLPKDADGVPIHIGDELDGYGYPNGGAYCKAILNEVMILAGPKDSSYRSWLMWDAAEVRHHHEPTVEDVLEEYRIRYYDLVTDIECENITNEEYVHGISSLNAEFAAKLQLKEPE